MKTTLFSLLLSAFCFPLSALGQPPPHQAPRITSFAVSTNALGYEWAVSGAFGFWWISGTQTEIAVDLSFTTKPNHIYRVECLREFCNPWIGTARCDWLLASDWMPGNGREVKFRHRRANFVQGIPQQFRSVFYRVEERQVHGLDLNR